MVNQNPLPVNSALALSILTSLGGAIGYARTGSIPSIAAGLSVGALYLLSFARLRSRRDIRRGTRSSGFGYSGRKLHSRVIKTGGKPVPLGLSVLATYGIVVFGLAFKEKRA
ncbi:hypothetical protein N7526_008953 [Penicillium atrosanguineum]|nr:hypothetical protein N7526_008953 [Penicillium atrosanguineum]